MTFTDITWESQIQPGGKNNVLSIVNRSNISENFPDVLNGNYATSGVNATQNRQKHIHREAIIIKI